MKRILTACILTVGLLSGGLVMRAADGTATEIQPGVPQPEKGKRMPFYGVVKKVDEKARTLTLVGKEKDRVFRITDATRIHDSGTAKTLKDVRVGRKVGGSAKSSPSGEWEIATLNLGVKQNRSSSGAQVEDVGGE